MKELSVFPIGEENTAFAQYFSGESYRSVVSSEQIKISNITFAPGVRNDWHIHHAENGGGQILLVTAGEGWYQEEGKAATALKAGDTVNIPAGVKHWHGAAKDSWFQHLSIGVPGEKAGTEWLDAVSDEAYEKL